MADPDLDGLFAYSQRIPSAVSFADPELKDTPIIHCNQAFTDLTGYDLDAAVGRNCRFLQVPETDADARAQLRKDVSSHTESVHALLNRRADGTLFNNLVYITPITLGANRTLLMGCQYAFNRLTTDTDVSRQIAARRQNAEDAMALAKVLDRRITQLVSRNEVLAQNAFLLARSYLVREGARRTASKRLRIT